MMVMWKFWGSLVRVCLMFFELMWLSRVDLMLWFVVVLVVNCFMLVLVDLVLWRILYFCFCLW